MDDARQALNEFAECNSHSAPGFKRALHAVLDYADRRDSFIADAGGTDPLSNRLRELIKENLS